MDFQRYPKIRNVLCSALRVPKHKIHVFFFIAISTPSWFGVVLKKNKMEARIKTAFYPKRKTTSFLQWRGYILSKLRESRGLEKHKSNEQI